MHRVPLFLIISAALMSLTSADADTTRPITLSERARGAQRIVVGRVVGSTASRERNSYGDDLIVSRFTLRVEEGTPARLISSTYGLPDPMDDECRAMPAGR